MKHFGITINSNRVTATAAVVAALLAFATYKLDVAANDAAQAEKAPDKQMLALMRKLNGSPADPAIRGELGALYATTEADHLSCEQRQAAQDIFFRVNRCGEDMASDERCATPLTVLISRFADVSKEAVPDARLPPC